MAWLKLVTVMLCFTLIRVEAFYDVNALNDVLREKNLDVKVDEEKAAALDEVYSEGDDIKSDPAPDWVRKVHIVSMNHLDVGYDGIPGLQSGLINNVLFYYFTKFFPRAVKLGRDLKAGGYVETFKYTTHPWLVSMYLDCPPDFVLSGIKLRCPNATEVRDFSQAVLDGVITWHAGPMNLQPEFAPSPSAFRHGLDLGTELDKRFGITRKYRVLSQRDVPGMTQAVIPILKGAGISGVTVGVNNMTPPPSVHVPPMFRWRFGGEEVLATWHAGGYPDTAGTVPSQPGGISVKDCVVIPDFPEALCFAFRSDNQGPPAHVTEVLGQYEVLRAEFPSAQLTASTLEDFFMAADKIKESFPVVDSEIGDTWIQGIASDPRKCAEIRAVGRALSACFTAGLCDVTDARVWNASRLFLKTFEHTWGLNGNGDFTHWSNAAFYPVMSQRRFTNCALAWREQRQMLYYSIQALGAHPVGKYIQLELEAIAPSSQTPDLTAYTEVRDHGTVFTCPHGMKIQFADDGSLQRLDYKGASFAGPGNKLGQFAYRSYNESDFAEFGTVYNYRGVSAGYYKHNLTNNTHAQSQTWPLKMAALYQGSSEKCDVWVQLMCSDPEMWRYYGSPEHVWLKYTARGDPERPGFDIDLHMYNKTVTRMPESITYYFRPNPQPQAKWVMSKLGALIDPLNVVLNGSQYEHVLDDRGMLYGPPGNLGNGATLQFQSPDVPIAVLTTESLPQKSAFPAPLAPIKDAITGVGFNIYNNIWDTNYIFWYPYLPEDANFKARFAINFVDSSQ